MSDYSSLKVPELKKLLAEKKLPQTGNKADLIARLQEEDKKNTDEPTASKPKAQEEKEDEITYTDDEEPAAAPVPAPASKAAEPRTTDDAQAAKQGKDEPETTQKPSETTEVSSKDDEEAKGETAPEEPAQSFAIGLSKTAAEAEAKKRADRAKRFGIEEDDESKRRAERASRFGIDEKSLASSLDAALPEKSLKRGRGRGGEEDSRAGKRQNVDRRGGRQGRDGRDRRDRRNGQNGRASRQGGRDGPAKMSNTLQDPVEKAKAEKRAARFAAA